MEDLSTEKPNVIFTDSASVL